MSEEKDEHAIPLYENLMFSDNPRRGGVEIFGSRSGFQRGAGGQRGKAA